MANYMSPNSFMTPNTFQASGTAGGFLAGQNQAMLEQMMNRQFIASDLQNQIENYKAQLAGAQLPGQEMAAQNNLSGQTAIQQNWQPNADGSPGLNVQNLNTGVQADIGKSLASQVNSAAEIQKQKLAVLSQIGGRIQQNGGTLDPNNPQDVALNQDLVNTAKNIGISFPNNTIDANSAKSLANLFQSNVNSPNQLQIMQKTAAEVTGRQNVANTQMEKQNLINASKLAVTQLQNENRMRIATIYAGLRAPLEKTATNLMQQILTKPASEVTAADMDGLVSALTLAFNSDHASTDLQKTTAQIQRDSGGTDPNPTQSALDKIMEQSGQLALNYVNQNPTLKALYEKTHGKNDNASPFPEQPNPSQSGGFTSAAPVMPGGKSAMQPPVLGIQQTNKDPNHPGAYVVNSQADFNKVYQQHGKWVMYPDGVSRQIP